MNCEHWVCPQEGKFHLVRTVGFIFELRMENDFLSHITIILSFSSDTWTNSGIFMNETITLLTFSVLDVIAIAMIISSLQKESSQ
jgi:hypothetical protein